MIRCSAVGSEALEKGPLWQRETPTVDMRRADTCGLDTVRLIYTIAETGEQMNYAIRLQTTVPTMEVSAGGSPVLWWLTGYVASVARRSFTSRLGAGTTAAGTAVSSVTKVETKTRDYEP